MTTPDSELLTAIKSKDQKAFEMFYNRYARLLQMWALKHTGDKDLTEDIAQNFWIILWTNPEAIKVNEKKSAKDYLLRYFTYRMLDYIKSAGAQILGNESKLLEATETLGYTHVFEELEIGEIHKLIDKVLGDTPDMTRKIFTLLWENNYSVKEAAEELKVSEKIIRTGYNKTIQSIRQQLLLLQSDESIKIRPETILVLFFLLDISK